MWRDARKRPITWEEITALITYDSEVIVGTDSQPFSSAHCVVTAVVIMNENRRFFYLEERVPILRERSLYERLLDETLRSIEVAQSLRDSHPSVHISVHLDVQNMNGSARSSRYCNSLSSIVRGYGYMDVEVKPDSWVASSLADKFTKKPSYLGRRSRSV
jgi:predicted RNase H-related nuclease YkuK (DUF458 family)